MWVKLMRIDENNITWRSFKNGCVEWDNYSSFNDYGGMLHTKRRFSGSRYLNTEVLL